MPAFLDKHIDRFMDTVAEYAPKVIMAIIVLTIGLWLVKRIAILADKAMKRKELDISLRTFLKSLMSIGLKIVLIVTVAGMIGIGNASFVTVLGAAGLAIGLALQGSLSNFAGGVLILIFKPFKLGDTIEAQGVSGTVIDIQIFVTQLLTANNQVIFVPNGALSNGTIINYSMQETRRTDLTIGVSYETNIKEVKDIIMGILNANEKILKHPVPTVSVRELTDSGIKIAIRAWTKNENFGDVTSEIFEDCKAAFDLSKIDYQPFIRETSK